MKRAKTTKPSAKSTPSSSGDKYPIPKPGDLIDWPIRAQGVNKRGRGPAVAVAPTGGPPCDVWPKNLPEPSARQLAGFRKSREHPYVIVSVEQGKRTVYRTPRLSAPIRILPPTAGEKRSKK